MDPIRIDVHDDVPREAGAIVDAGLGAFNDAAAPLHEVRPLSCLAKGPGDEVIGGAVGRTWGQAAEIQRLWVSEAHRRGGIGATLVRAFEARAVQRGCRALYLETLSFQAPRFYASLGYRVVFELRALPHGVVRFTMLREIG